MLASIWSDKFKRNNETRPPIDFHYGLNSIRGGQGAENDIGKSTLLYIIDYAFGGSQFAESKAVSTRAAGHHSIYFTFRFDNIDYYFSRFTGEKDFVHVYADPNYQEEVERWDLDYYNDWLKHKYHLDYVESSFRNIISRFFRIQKRAQVSYEEPMQSHARESMSAAVDVVYQLFGVFGELKELKKELANATKDVKAIRRTQKTGIYPVHALRGKRNYENAVSEAKKLEGEFETLIKGTDQQMLNIAIEKASKAETIRARVKNMQMEYQRLHARREQIKNTLEQRSIGISDSDLDQLQALFPGINLEKLDHVQRFHTALSDILISELQEQELQYNEALEQLEVSIQQGQNRIRELGETVEIPDKTIRDGARISARLELTREQIAAWEATEKIKEQLKQLQDELATKRYNIDRNIEHQINQRIAELDRYIHGDSTQWEPAIFRFKDNGNGYTYGNEVDEGTGTTGKNLILFHLAMLDLTPVPAVIHDSPLPKSIADVTVGKVLELYETYAEKRKQIFIAFDKDTQYAKAPQVQRIIEETSVIEVGEDSEALYGWAWNKTQKGTE